jgi:hypothetical protein
LGGAPPAGHPVRTADAGRPDGWAIHGWTRDAKKQLFLRLFADSFLELAALRLECGTPRIIQYGEKRVQGCFSTNFRGVKAVFRRRMKFAAVDTTGVV